jgi:hypothetical protein
LSFVNFQEKLTGTSFALCACEASFVRLAVCLALGALFASTASINEINAHKNKYSTSRAKLSPTPPLV